MSMRTRLGVLADFDFRQLFLADTVSQLGTQVTQLALPLVAVLALHASAFEVGLLAAADTAAFLIVGLPAGALVDRLRRRNVMIAGDLARAILLGSVPFAWWMGWLSMPQLYLVGLGTGLATVFFDVAYQSYLPHLVGRGSLVEGNAKLQGVQSVSQLAGPTAAGFLIQALTAPYAIVVDAVSFVGSAFFVGRIRKLEDKPERGPDAHLGREISEGFNFVVRNKVLRSIAACTGSSNLFSGIGGAMLILLLAGHLHISAGLIGVVFSLMSHRRPDRRLDGAAVREMARPGSGHLDLDRRHQSVRAVRAADAAGLEAVGHGARQLRLLDRRRCLQRQPGQLPPGAHARPAARPHERDDALPRLGHAAARWPDRWHPRPDDRRAQHAVGQRDRRNVLVPVRVLLARAPGA